MQRHISFISIGRLILKRSIIKTAAFAGALSVLFSINVFANWTMDHIGYRWMYEDESYAADTWLWLDGNQDGIAECYYFDHEGYMLKSMETPDGYTVDANGSWILDGVVQTKSSAELDGTQAAADASASDSTGTNADNSTGSSEAANSTETEDTAPAAAETEIPVETVGGLKIRLAGEFEGAQASREGSKLSLISGDQSRIAVVMAIDLTQDEEYAAVLEMAQSFGLDLNSDSMKSLILDSFEQSFTASMGQSPVGKADKSFSTGTWRHLRFDPSAVNGTYSDILIKYDNNIFYTIILGGENGYVDADRFMTEELFI